MTLIEPYGALGGEVVQAVTLRSGALRARLIAYGARLTELWLPDRRGDPADVVLGHDTLEEYRATPTYFGATVGRYANRIEGGRLRLDGQDHRLDVNEGGNHLHGGAEGFDRAVWALQDASETWATFAHVSPEGDMGYPGRLEAAVTYELSEDGLRVSFQATADRPTVVNLVHHSYFNLAGEGDVLGHDLRLDAPFWTPVDEALLATGEVRSVEGTPFDFRAGKPIGEGIGEIATKGWDHNWVLGGAGEDLRDCARLRDPGSGRWLSLRTSEPGVQVYAGGYLTPGLKGKGGRPSVPFGGVTLETQRFPGSPTHPHFPSAVLRPGDTYRHEMAFAFGAD